MIAPLPHRDHASPMSTNPPRTSLHPNTTQRPTGAPIANGTESTPIRLHHITHTRIPPSHHLPALTYTRTPWTQRTQPYRTPTTTTYAFSRRPTHHHHPNPSVTAIARHQHRPQHQHSRPSSNPTGTPRPPHSTTCLRPAITATTPQTAPTTPSFINPFAQHQLPPPPIPTHSTSPA